MDTWLERAERYGDVSPSGGTSLNHVNAGALSSIKDTIMRGLKAGLTTAAIMATISVPYVYRDNISNLIDQVRGSEIPITEQDLIDSMEQQQLDMSVLPVPVGEPVPHPQGRVKYEDIASELSGVEGNYNYVYDDASTGAKPWSKSQNGKPTIGIGHWMNGSAEDRNLFSELFGDDIDYDRLLANTQTLSGPQVIKLFSHDSGSRIRWALKTFPKFKTFDGKTQAAIMSAKYRGDMGPNTIGFINRGDWAGAAKEFLNHQEYREVKRKVENNEPTNKRGIISRLEGIAEIFESNAR